MSERDSNNRPDPEEPNASITATRRRVMAAGGSAWATVTLAGCAGLTGDDEEPEPTDDDDEPVDDDDDEPATEPENYVVTDDMIAGSAYVPEGAGGFAQACAPQRQFVPGMQAVFKIGVWDPATGDILGDDVLDEVTVDTDRGATIELEFDDEDEEWSGNWPIPDDEDAGSVGYTVEVTNDGQFTRVGVLESEFEIIEFDDPTNYVVTTDTYTGSSGIPEDNAGGFAQACSPQHTYAQGMMVGFQVGIYDANTGELVDDEVIDEAIIELDRGVELELEWDGEDEEWQVAWHDTADAEPGTVTYTVEVTNDGEFHRVGIQEDEFEIIEYDP